MTSRNPMPGDTTTKPGPGAHHPEKVGYAATILLHSHIFILCYLCVVVCNRYCVYTLL